MSISSHEEVVEYYIKNYVTKDKEKVLEYNTSNILATLNYSKENKSKVEDIDIYQMINIKFLSAITINYFQKDVDN